MGEREATLADIMRWLAIINKTLESIAAELAKANHAKGYH